MKITVLLTGHQSAADSQDIFGGLRILLGADKGNVTIKVDLLPTGQHTSVFLVNTGPSEPNLVAPAEVKLAASLRNVALLIDQQRWNTSTQKINLTSELVNR